jgi:hypothetical protein
MILSDISIRRPVFAWMLMAGLIVFGAISFNRLGVSQMPDVDFRCWRCAPRGTARRPRSSNPNWWTRSSRR